MEDKSSTSLTLSTSVPECCCCERGSCFLKSDLNTFTRERLRIFSSIRSDSDTGLSVQKGSRHGLTFLSSFKISTGLFLFITSPFHLYRPKRSRRLRKVVAPWLEFLSVPLPLH